MSTQTQRAAGTVVVEESGFARNPVRVVIGDRDFSQAVSMTDAEAADLHAQLSARLAPNDDLAEAEAVIELVSDWRDRQNTPVGALSGHGELLRIIEGRERTALATVVAAAVAAERERCALLVENHTYHIGKSVQLVKAIRS
jgi:hypothetical protein